MPRFGELKMQPGPAWGRGCWNLMSARFPAQPGPLAAPLRIASLRTKFWRIGWLLGEPDSRYGSFLPRCGLCPADSSVSPGWGGRSLCSAPAWCPCLGTKSSLSGRDGIGLVFLHGALQASFPRTEGDLQCPFRLLKGWSWVKEA